MFTRVLQRHVHDSGIDYGGVARDSNLVSYLAWLSAQNPSALSDSGARLALWINAYNAWTLKLIADHYPVASIRDISVQGNGPWDIPFAVVGGRTYTLNDIEHRIIRKDFREPMIHMALVCAARSCPPLRREAYTGKGLLRQLESNTAAFLSDSGKNRVSGDTLYLSEIFRWFDEDFRPVYGGGEGFVRQWRGFSGVSIGHVRYLPYDWGLNAK